jgi:hypothetical protein
MGNGPELTTLNGPTTPHKRQHQRHISANDNTSTTPNGHISTTPNGHVSGVNSSASAS